MEINSHRSQPVRSLNMRYTLLHTKCSYRISNSITRQVYNLRHGYFALGARRLNDDSSKIATFRKLASLSSSIRHRRTDVRRSCPADKRIDLLHIIIKLCVCVLFLFTTLLILDVPSLRLHLVAVPSSMGIWLIKQMIDLHFISSIMILGTCNITF